MQAPAGSGKTELLTQRYLVLLAQAAHREEVVAITDPAEDDEATADGQIPYVRIKDRLTVPTHFFKIIAATVDGRTQAIAFVLENKSYGNRRDVESFIKPVRWIEDRAGFDFMPDLDALTQQDIETKPSVMWSIK